MSFYPNKPIQLKCLWFSLSFVLMTDFIRLCCCCCLFCLIKLNRAWYLIVAHCLICTPLSFLPYICYLSGKDKLLHLYYCSVIQTDCSRRLGEDRYPRARVSIQYCACAIFSCPLFWDEGSSLGKTSKTQLNVELRSSSSGKTISDTLKLSSSYCFTA